jgi:hypothetical protein
MGPRYLTRCYLKPRFAVVDVCLVSGRAVVAARRLAEVPEELARASSLQDPAYVDAFDIDLETPAPSAEVWGRSVFEGAPAAVRRLIVIGWRLGLGLRLGPRTPEHVLGWRITALGATSLTLEQESWMLSAQVVCWTSEKRSMQATFVRYDSSLGRWLWPPLSALHRFIVAYLLRRAATALIRRR